LPAASGLAHQGDHEQRDHRADGGVDNCRQDAADRDVKGAKLPAADESTTIPTMIMMLPIRPKPNALTIWPESQPAIAPTMMRTIRLFNAMTPLPVAAYPRWQLQMATN
jgi:hypothetical protein